MNMNKRASFFALLLLLVYITPGRGTEVGPIGILCRNPFIDVTFNTTSDALDYLNSAPTCTDILFADGGTGYQINFSEGTYTGPDNCEQTWPTNSNVAINANGIVQFDCAQKTGWRFEYTDTELRQFELRTVPTGRWKWKNTRIAVWLRAVGPSNLVVRVTGADFVCNWVPAAIFASTPNAIKNGISLFVTNSTFQDNGGTALTTMGAVSSTFAGVDFNGNAEGDVSCMADDNSGGPSSGRFYSNRDYSLNTCLFCDLQARGTAKLCNSSKENVDYTAWYTCGYEQAPVIYDPPTYPTSINTFDEYPSETYAPKSEILFGVLVICGAGVVFIVTAWVIITIWRYKKRPEAAAPLDDLTLTEDTEDLDKGQLL